MANRILEVLLDRVEVKKTNARRKKGRHMVIATLIWPRPMIAERISVKTLDFEDNIINLKKSNWIARIMFKEKVEGPFGIEFNVTERMSDSEITKFLQFLGSSLMKLAGNEAKDLMTSSLAGGLVKIPFQHLDKFISKLGDKGPKIIANGSLVLHSEDTWNPSSRKNSAAVKSFKVALTAPEIITQVTRTRRHGEIQSRRRTIMKAGEDNGIINFTGKVYG
ncbi:MAG: hypothetical protein KAH23_01570 [Kiritimatiellae bacterium]|nr:hypothetical protein [Kiritimatiellia bacterium]